MSLPRSHFLPITPTIVDDARALVSCADMAAAAPESLRRLAWLVTASAHGQPARQLPHRPRSLRRPQ